MKLSDKPTNYVLLKAGTNSEWDNCNFAIVYISEAWRTEKRKQLEGVKPFIGDYTFMSLNYFDTQVDFFVSDNEDNPDLGKWLSDRSFVFVEPEKDELQNFLIPESRLDCYTLVVYSTGTAIYNAYGKHTGDEFYTEQFSLTELIGSYENNIY